MSGSPSAAPDDITVELRAARWTLQVVTGIGSAVAIIGLGLLLFVLFPSLPAREATPLSLILVLGLPAVAILGAVRTINGPRVRLRVGSGVISLIHARQGEVLATCSIEEASPSKDRARVVGRSGTFRFASVGLRLPGRGPLVIATLDRRFEWGEPDVEWGEPTHWVDSHDWVPLVTSLGLEQPVER